MGLFDKLAEKSPEKFSKIKNLRNRDIEKKRQATGFYKPKSSKANEHFTELSKKKKEMAKKVDSVLGDTNYSYLRKGGRTVGFTQNT